MKSNIYTTKSSEETEKLGKEFAKNLKGGEVVFLYGELGAGKTTFTKGLAQGLEIQERIISPTFVLIRKHEIKVKSQKSRPPRKRERCGQAKVKSLYHVDLYRIESENDIKSLGLEDLLKDKDSIVVIEWPEKLSSTSIVPTWEIKFEYVDENERRITINEL